MLSNFIYLSEAIQDEGDFPQNPPLYRRILIYFIWFRELEKGGLQTPKSPKGDLNAGATSKLDVMRYSGPVGRLTSAMI